MTPPKKAEPVEVHTLLIREGVSEVTSARVYRAVATAWAEIGAVACDDETREQLASLYWGALVTSLENGGAP